MCVIEQKGRKRRIEANGSWIVMGEGLCREPAIHSPSHRPYHSEAERKNSLTSVLSVTLRVCVSVCVGSCLAHAIMMRLKPLFVCDTNPSRDADDDAVKIGCIKK